MAPGIRQHRRHRPFDLVTATERNAAQIRGLHLRQADVDHRRAMPFGDLRHQLRFADAGRSPEHHRRMVASLGGQELPVENDGELGRTHHSTVATM